MVSDGFRVDASGELTEPPEPRQKSRAGSDAGAEVGLPSGRRPTISQLAADGPFPGEFYELCRHPEICSISP